MSKTFDGYGSIGNVFSHDMIVMPHHEVDKRKRRMCRCGCRKKVTHIQFCNGVAMNSGCEKSLNQMIERINKRKSASKKRSADLMKKFGLDKIKVKDDE